MPVNIIVQSMVDFVVSDDANEKGLVKVINRILKNDSFLRQEKISWSNIQKKLCGCKKNPQKCDVFKRYWTLYNFHLYLKLYLKDKNSTKSVNYDW